MTRLQRGGRQLIDQLLADLADIEHTDRILEAAEAVLYDLPLDLIKWNPALVDDRLRELRQLLTKERRHNQQATAAIRRRLEDDLPKMLFRNERNAEAASIPERIADMERRLAELEAQAQLGRIIPLRNTGP